MQKIALGHRGNGARDLAGRPKKVIDQGVDGAFHVGPGAAGDAEPHALAGLPLATDNLADALELLRHPLIGGDDLVERIRDLAVDPEIIAAHAHREVAGTHGLERPKQILTCISALGPLAIPAEALSLRQRIVGAIEIAHQVPPRKK